MGKKLAQVFEQVLHSCVDEQYPSNMTSTHNHKNLSEYLRKFIARVSSELMIIIAIIPVTIAQR